MFDFIKYLQNNRLTLTDRMADRAKNSNRGKKLVKENISKESSGLKFTGDRFRKPLSPMQIKSIETLIPGIKVDTEELPFSGKVAVMYLPDYSKTDISKYESGLAKLGLTATEDFDDKSNEYYYYLKPTGSSKNEEYNPEVPDSDQRIGSSDKTASRMGGNQSKLADLKRKKDELVKKFTSGQIDINQYKQMIGNIPQQIKALQAALDKETMPIGDDEDDSVYEGVEDFTEFVFQSRKNGVKAGNIESFIQQMEKLGFEVDPTATASREWAVGLPKFKGINGPMKDPNGKSIYYADQETTDAYANESKVNELEVEPESDLGQSVQKLAKINEQIEKLSVEMKKLEREYGELEKPIYAILEDLNTLHDDVDKSIKVGNQLIVSFKTKPTQVTNYKYKEAFTYLEGKVNGALKKLVNEIKDAHKSVSSRKGTISVTKLDEAEMDVSKFNSIATEFSDAVDSIHNIVAKLTGSKQM